MTKPDILSNPTIKIETITEISTEREIAENVREESQVIIHCSFTAVSETVMIRIWNSTFLYPKGSDQRSKLVHTENITLFPLWTAIEKGHTLNFTLIFTALPKDCLFFDMIENIPESGGFMATNIKRNETDVYQVDLT